MCASNNTPKKIFKTSLSNRIEGFDELRGIAVMMVLISHWGMVCTPLWAFDLGPIGVDIFFVISGFLIGLILLKSKGKVGYYRNFYVRRVFRIMPLAFIMILMGLVLQLATKNNIGSFWYYCTFTQNYIPAFLAPNIDKTNVLLPLPGTDPMWSLAVEEHTYLCLPLIIGVLNKKFIPNSIVIVSLVGVSVSLYTTKSYEYGSYTNLNETWNRMHYIAMGVLLCRREWWMYVVAVMLYWFALIVIMDIPAQFIQYAIAIGICVTVWMVREKKSPLRNKYLADLGKLCYGVYLLHYPLAIVFKELSVRNYMNSCSLQVVSFISYIVITTVLAYLSFKYFEMPIQRQRWRFEK